MHAHAHRVELDSGVVDEADERDVVVQAEGEHLGAHPLLVVLVPEHRRTDDPEPHVRTTLHDRRRSPHQLELSLRRADPSDDPHDRRLRPLPVARQKDLLLPDAGVGDHQPLDTRQGRSRGAGVGDHGARGAPGKRTEDPDRGGRQVVRRDAIVHVPDQRTASPPSSGHREQVGLERGRVHHVGVDGADRRCQRSNRRQCRPDPTGGVDVPEPFGTPEATEVARQREHVHVDSTLAQTARERAVLQQGDGDQEAVAGHRGEQPLQRQLGATERGRVVHHEHPDATVHDQSPHDTTARTTGADRDERADGCTRTRLDEPTTMPSEPRPRRTRGSGAILPQCPATLPRP